MRRTRPRQAATAVLQICILILLSDFKQREGRTAAGVAGDGNFSDLLSLLIVCRFATRNCHRFVTSLQNLSRPEWGPAVKLRPFCLDRKVQISPGLHPGWNRSSQSDDLRS